ncbi:hypothetical protein [Micromonospora lutea]|uniref:Peptidase M3A/M3B catalytic domain-containing protein n=1 Tax=Micromonospora lutea TaxID=419825 RepID=A0ABQ4J0P2_9ACTN|nr:hypothetical protein [Micromonospora lutea]GIJ23783.1 hypothetical protein Vlu01_44070 [Micromonospora lutea]
MSTHPLIESLRPPVDTILDTIAEAEARYCLGEATTFEPAKIHAAWPDVFGPDTVTALRAAGIADGSGRPFVGLVLQALMEAETTPLRTRIAEREKTVTVTDGNGGRIDLARARRLAATAPDVGVPRDTLHDLYDREIAPLWLESEQRRLTVVKAAGYRDLIDYADRVQRHDLGRLEREARAFLDSTRARYESIRRPRFAAGSFTVAQLIGAARTTFVDPVDLATCLPLLRLLVSELGLEFAPRIRLDLEARPGKVPGAYCLPVRVPDDIVVAVSPGGGVGDCRPLFHEVGHALHFAYTCAELPVDGRRMGDEGLVEGWGVVTENMFLHPGWLNRSFPAGTAAALGNDTAQRLLIVTRAQCVRLLFAVDAARRPADPAELRSRYDQLMAEHLAARPGPIEYLDVLCGDFVSATRLRSWEFGTSIAGLLAHEIGPEWPGDPQAGRWLVEHWRVGVSHTAAEAIDRWVAPPLSLDAVAENLTDSMITP